MTRESDYVQWAKDAAADHDYTRAAEFWLRAHLESGALRYADELAACEALIATAAPAKQRTGRRTIRGDTAHGVIIMEFTPPNLVTFREKGRRKRYPSTVAALFDYARRAEARRLQDERIKARKLKRAAKAGK